ncbi:hypothetical protein IAD21_00822 [Abditibacteriota bacterium]|nr:hypothetical protein IAD21_00822 [Abditibacteriota bacterium]
MKTLFPVLALALLAGGAHAQDADFSKLSDEFNGDSDFKSWQKLQIEGWADKWQSATPADGVLTIIPRSSGWYEDNFGGLLYREIEGDFSVSARVRAKGKNSALPRTLFSLVGVFVRSPHEVTAQNWKRGQENWLFFSTGCADKAGTPQFEIKSTVNSVSKLEVRPAATGWIQVKITRSGANFQLAAKRDEDAEWTPIKTIERPDFPTKLQVGLTAYSDWGSVQQVYPNYELYNTQGTPQNNADLVADVDWIHFER